MRSLPTSLILAVAGFGLLPAAGLAQISCYNDENGRRICSDSIPPDDARHDREILNSQGIVIREEQGEITPEEQAVIDEQQRLEEERIRETEEQRRYGQMLLDSYSSVDGIVTQRDRILEQIAGQITVIELYLSNLNNKLEDLERQAQRFAPYSDREDAPPLPENLALDIERTRSSIKLFTERREESLKSQRETEDEYARHIRTFRQITGDNTPVPEDV